MNSFKAIFVCSVLSMNYFVFSSESFFGSYDETLHRMLESSQVPQEVINDITVDMSNVPLIDEKENREKQRNEEYLKQIDAALAPFRKLFKQHKKIIMTIGSGAAAFTINITSENQLAAAVLMGIFVTSFKGYLGKNTEKQGLKMTAAVSALLLGYGLDYVLKSYLGFNPNGTFTNLTLGAFLGTLKALQKGHIRSDKDQPSDEEKKEKALNMV